MQASSQSARFEEAILPHLDAAYNLARWLVKNQADAEDLVQEASLRAFRAFSGFRGGDARAWLLAIVRNACFSWLRDTRRWEPIEFDEQIHSEDPSGAQPLLERRLVEEAARQTLQKALEDLPPEFREVIVLRELEELSYKEIGDIAGVPIGTVMSRLARARARLQLALAPEAARGSERGSKTISEPSTREE